MERMVLMVKMALTAKNAVAWTIGVDGYWYEDGVKRQNIKLSVLMVKMALTVKTVKMALTAKMAKTVRTVKMVRMAKMVLTAKMVKYYYPNVETGCFDIYQDGKKDRGYSDKLESCRS